MGQLLAATVLIVCVLSNILKWVFEAYHDSMHYSMYGGNHKVTPIHAPSLLKSCC